MSAKRTNVALEEYYKAHGKEIPLGRAGEPEEFANLACLLASEQWQLHHRHSDQCRRWAFPRGVRIRVRERLGIAACNSTENRVSPVARPDCAFNACVPA